jgi:gamma-glutamyltranspeptidase/glutathione hydrolase
MNISWSFPYASRRMPVLARNVVATSQPLAVQAGLCMLRNGGNAVDAALAAAIALTIVEPTCNGIGSDAFAILWDGKSLHGFNGSGRSPAALTFEQFKHREKMPQWGWDPVTVPGAVDTWVQLSDRFGKLPFENLFGPAISYAEKGFLVSPLTARGWANMETRTEPSEAFRNTFLPGGRAPRAGELFACPGQAESLKSIARSHGESLYRGELARKIVSHARGTGGVMTETDLAGHAGEWVEPVEQAYGGICLHEIPPNGQGLTALIALGILAHHGIGSYPVDSPDSIHLQIEAMKIAFAEAHRHIADPDFMDVSVEELLDDTRLAEQAREIDMQQAQFPVSALPADHGTVYLAAADADGMMVSFIQSNFCGFGSGIVIPGTGISLQNRGYGFVTTEGHPNCVAGGKKPYHTIIPGFVTCETKPLMSFGVMGGHMQPQGHFQTILRIFEYGQNPQAASDAPRWHVADDFSIDLEEGMDHGVARELKARGHIVRDSVPPGIFGGGQFILKLKDGYCAASDHRKDGQAAGF